MGIKIRVQKGIIYLVIYYNGYRRQQSTGLHVTENKTQNNEVMKLAEILRSKAEVRLVERRNGFNSEEAKMSLYDFIKKCSIERGHDSQIYKVLPYLERFDCKIIKLEAVTPQYFENLQNRFIKDSGLKAATCEKYMCSIRLCLKKAVRDGILMSDPSTGIKHIRIPEVVKDYLTAEELRRMVFTPYKMPKTDEALQMDIRKAFLFGCCTGFRISDLTQLVWGNLDLDRMVIQKRQQKTQRVVCVPLNEDAWLLINDNKKHEPKELIFPELANTRTSTNRYIIGWAKEAGIQKHVTWHTGRHTDATLLIEYGADLYTVQRLLGHTKIATTARYAKITDRKQREAVNNLPEIGIKEMTVK